MVPTAKVCPSCAKSKGLGEFHSKGNGRYERDCKVCSNNKKNIRNQGKKKKLEQTKRTRKETKTLNIADFEIVDQQSEQFVADIRHLEMLLQDFVFDFSEGNEDEEKNAKCNKAHMGLA